MKEQKTKSQQAQEYAEKVNYPCPDYGWYESDDNQMKECLTQVWLDGYTDCEQSMTDREATVIQGWVAKLREVLEKLVADGDIEPIHVNVDEIINRVKKEI